VTQERWQAFVMGRAGLVTVVALMMVSCGSSDRVAVPRVAPTTIQAGAQPRCGDLLKRARVEPVAGIVFDRCETSRPGAQLRSLIATYRVTGNPKVVEAALVKRFTMAPMVFRCCGWEPKDPTVGRFTTFDNYYVNVAMASGETVERDWSKIAFTVTVEQFLESP
jgi:hypothetical protein